MLNRISQQLLIASLVIAPAVHAQAGRSAPPRELDGAWELVSVAGRQLPLPPVREGGDPSECGTYGQFVGSRIGEGRLVIRADEMLSGPRSGRWEGGVYGYFPEEIICRSSSGGTVALRRDEHRRTRPAGEVSTAWRSHGSYGMQDNVAVLAVGDDHWIVTTPSTSRAGMITAEGPDGQIWVFRRAEDGPRFELIGFTTVRGDFDADGQRDQVSVAPTGGAGDPGNMEARLASGDYARVAEVPAGAHVALATRGFRWRNADGEVLQLADRDAVIVSVEPAPGRSDVLVYYLRNGAWVAWAYAPD
jgi:hypothetical protein